MLWKSDLGKLEEEEGEDEEEKKKPWKQESSSPGSQPVTRQTGNMRCKIGNIGFLNGPLSESLSPVAHCWEASEKCEESATKHHSVVLVLHLVGEGHRDQGDAADEVADVEEEEASEEGEGGSEEPRSLLAGPQAPEGGGEVPDCVHRRHLLLTESEARWRRGSWVRQLLSNRGTCTGVDSSVMGRANDFLQSRLLDKDKGGSCRRQTLSNPEVRL